MALDPTWQVLLPGAPGAVPASSLGISNLTRSRRNLAADTVTLTAGGRAADAAPLCAYGQTVKILRAGVPWFAGLVTATPATGSGSAQSQSYTLSGPWWYLDHLTYRQQWKFQGGATEQFIGRLILGQDLDGTFVTSGAVITEMLNYAIGAGAPFQIGGLVGATRCSSSIALGTLIPLDEVKDVTCAEVFRKMARWTPNCVAWFDYSTTPPTLNYAPGGEGGTAGLTKGRSPLVSVGALTPRYDLQAPSVVIHYEVTSSSNGASSLTVVTDAAPAGATGTEFGSVVLTIPLRGQSSTSTQQRVNTVAIQDTIPTGDDANPAALIAYLAGRSDALAADVNDPSITASGITITACSRTLADPSADAFDPLTGEYGAQDGYDDSLGYELVDGAITDWMGSQYAIKTQDQIITFSWTADASADGGSPGAPKTATIRLKATNALAQVYTMLTSYSQGDAVPTGLAAAYLATISALPWSGSVVLEEAQAGVLAPLAVLGNALNIAGSANAAWATMGAFITGEETDAAAGRTTLTLGPEMHLSPQDLVARLQITRPGGTGGRQDTGGTGTANSAARTSGAPSPDTTVPGATGFPVKDGGTLLVQPVTIPPQPFDVIAATGVGPSTVYGQVNPSSLFTPDESAADTMDVAGLGTSMALTPGTVWLQLTPDGSGNVGAVSVQSGSGFGDQRIMFSSAVPYVWQQTNYPIAQILASTGTPTQGGVILRSADGTAAVEVCQLASSHLGATGAVPNGVFGFGVIKISGTFGS